MRNATRNSAGTVPGSDADRRAAVAGVNSPDADGWVHRLPAWERDESERRYDDAESAAEARDFVSWALPQIDENRRRVLELTLYGAEIPEIMEELGITRENAYQRRSRGLKDLAKLKERYDA